MSSLSNLLAEYKRPREAKSGTDTTANTLSTIHVENEEVNKRSKEEQSNQNQATENKNTALHSETKSSSVVAPAQIIAEETVIQLPNQMLIIGTETGTDKVSHHGYHRFYTRFLDPLRQSPGGMLEIGIDQSHSLQLWLRYFPRAFIYGLDIGVELSGERFKVFQKDQSDMVQLETMVKSEIKHPIFFIIDDGSHIPEHQVKTFNYLFEHLLLDGGVYIIEDIETSYWTKGGLYGYPTNYGPRHKWNIIEIFKNLLDDINYEFLNSQARRDQDRALDRFFSEKVREMIESISFGQNCIIITKNTIADRNKFVDRKYRYWKNL